MTAYELEVGSGNGTSSWSVAYTGPATLAPAAGLTASTAYVARVRARNSVGFGPWSLVLPFETPAATAPGAISPPPHLTFANSSALGLAWAAPADNGGSAVTGYVVEMDDWFWDEYVACLPVAVCLRLIPCFGTVKHVPV